MGRNAIEFLLRIEGIFLNAIAAASIYIYYGA